MCGFGNRLAAGGLLVLSEVRVWDSIVSTDWITCSSSVLEGGACILGDKENTNGLKFLSRHCLLWLSWSSSTTYNSVGVVQTTGLEIKEEGCTK